MASEQPERSQFTPTDPERTLHDAIDWGRLADIDAARRILLRVAGTGERGHLPLTAEQAATFVVDAIAEQIHARGIAEGLRQATEGFTQARNGDGDPLWIFGCGYEAEEAVLGDRMANTLLVRKGEWNRAVTIATLALVNVRKWEWLAAEQPEDGERR